MQTLLDWCTKQNRCSEADTETLSVAQEFPETKGGVRMNDVIGIVWFKDELTYCRALAIFTDSEDMPATYEDWQALVRRQCEEIKGAGNIAIRADIDPETFTDWCKMRGFPANSQGRIAFVNHIELEYQKTGKGAVIE